MLRHPAVPYVAPFALFMVFLAIRSFFPVNPAWEYPVRVVVVSAAVLYFSRHLLNLRIANLTGSVLMGALVFLIWIAPELIWPGYRGHWLFQNPVLIAAASSVPPAAHSSPAFLFFRILGAVVLVPIIEELFWRGWLMRYLIKEDFGSVPLGAYAARSFWITAILFASEHGPYWEVGLAAGILYNLWMVRTKSLTDCILAHTVTNGCLALYVVAFQQWQYWP